MEKKLVNGEMVDVEEVKPELNDDGTPVVVDPVVEELEAELDEEGNPVEKVVEPWQETEEEDAGPLGVMPVAAHVRYKQKKKAATEKIEADLLALQEENKALKAGTFKPEAAPARPTRTSFDDDEAYFVEMEKYEDAMTSLRLKRQKFNETHVQQQAQYKEVTEKAVDSHYERAAKIVKDTGISPEVYQETDKQVRTAVDSVIPNMGDIVVDQMITTLGEGSEKVFYYLGRNHAALDRFKSLLIDDKSGMKAMVFLGQQKERLTSSGKQRSKAPAPSPNLGNGGVNNDSAGVKKAKKAYEVAHKKGDIQAAYDAKQSAKKAGANVSSW